MMKQRSQRVMRIEKQLNSLVKQRGKGVLDTVNGYVNKIDLNDPKTQLAITVAPYIGKALWSLSKAGYKAINNRFGKSIDDKFQPALPGEDPAHAPGYNFLGPGSNAQQRIKMGVQPVNQTDRAAMQHDLEYTAIKNSFLNGRITREQADRLTRLSDNKLQRTLSDVKPATTGETVVNKVANVAIGAKKVGEDLGLLDAGEFVGLTGNGKKRPLNKLKKQAFKQVGHGKKKKKNAKLNKMLAMIGAQLLLKARKDKQHGGNMKQITDSIGNFFNQTIPHTFTKTIPGPFIGAYNDTSRGLQNAYNTVIGY